MRLPRPRFTIIRMMMLIAVLGVGTWAFARIDRSQSYYAAGWWNAECELWQGNATIYGLGGMPIGNFCGVDQNTGLPIYHISGCVIGERDLERIEGHNDHIAQYVRWHGLPKNTLRPWEKVLFNLKRFFDDRSLHDAPKRLLAGGPPLISPDCRNSVQLVAGRNDSGNLDDSLKVVIAAGNAVLEDWYAHFDRGDSDLLWGPKGSRFAVIRSVSEKTEHYAAYDLKTGDFLREEAWHDGHHLDMDELIRGLPHLSE